MIYIIAGAVIGIINLGLSLRILIELRSTSRPAAKAVSAEAAPQENKPAPAAKEVSLSAPRSPNAVLCSKCHLQVARWNPSDGGPVCVNCSSAN
jgi:hypothetical protein